MAKIIHQRFDKLVKATLYNKHKAKEFFRKFLPEEIKKLVDFDKGFKLINTEFVTHSFKGLRCDIVYQARLKGKKGYIYFHIESQSKPEKLLPIRMLAYMIEIMMWHWDNVDKNIPPIYNCILYNGKDSPYPNEVSFIKLLEKNKLALDLFLSGPTLVDVSSLSDDKILDYLEIGLMTLFLKHSTNKKDFYDYLQEMKRSSTALLARQTGVPPL